MHYIDKDRKKTYDYDDFGFCDDYLHSHHDEHLDQMKDDTNAFYYDVGGDEFHLHHEPLDQRNDTKWFPMFQHPSESEMNYYKL